MKNTDFNKSNLSDSEFITCDINNTNFRDIIGKHIVFQMNEENIMMNSNFIGATLESADFEDCNIKNINFRNSNLISAYFGSSSLDTIIFDNTILTEANFENTKFTERISITENTKLDFANFTGSNINISLLEKANLKNTLGLNNHFEIEFEQIRKENLYLREKINNTNNKLNNSEKKKITLIEQNKVIRDSRTQSLIDGFIDLEIKLTTEESIWYKRTRNLVIFLSIYIFSILILSIFFKNYNIELYIEKALFGLLVFSTTYFSAYQFTKIKNLRLENSNKIAIAKGYQGFLFIHKDDDLKEVINNVTDVLFTKIKHIKERNLPIDEIIKLVKSIKQTKFSEKELTKLISEKINEEIKNNEEIN